MNAAQQMSQEQDLMNRKKSKNLFVLNAAVKKMNMTIIVMIVKEKKKTEKITLVQDVGNMIHTCIAQT